MAKCPVCGGNLIIWTDLERPMGMDCEECDWERARWKTSDDSWWIELSTRYGAIVDNVDRTICATMPDYPEEE